MWGLGDCVYARPFVRAAVEKWDVYLKTPWPELYSDLPVRFVRWDRVYRTQQKNTERQPASLWQEPPKGARELKVHYGKPELLAGSLLKAVANKFVEVGVLSNLSPFDLPDMGPSPVTSERPIVVIKAVTLRKEWLGPARNPLPEYIPGLAKGLYNGGLYEVVAVADTDDENEWLVGGKPIAHHSFLRGELLPKQLLALVQHAALVIGGVGWNVPVTIALKRPSFVVMGGLGAYNHPNKITDPRLDLSRIHFAMPPRLCPCTIMQHACNKRIPDLWAQLTRFSQRLGHLLPGTSPSTASLGGQKLGLATSPSSPTRPTSTTSNTSTASPDRPTAPLAGP